MIHTIDRAMIDLSKSFLFETNYNYTVAWWLKNKRYATPPPRKKPPCDEKILGFF